MASWPSLGTWCRRPGAIVRHWRAGSGSASAGSGRFGRSLRPVQRHPGRPGSKPTGPSFARHVGTSRRPEGKVAGLGAYPSRAKGSALSLWVGQSPATPAGSARRYAGRAIYRQCYVSAARGVSRRRAQERTGVWAGEDAGPRQEVSARPAGKERPRPECLTADHTLVSCVLFDGNPQNENG